MELQNLMEKVQGAKTPEELLALAKEAGIQMSPQKAEEIFALLNKKGEISDEELDNVSGGSNSVELPLHCRQCGGSSFGLCLKEIAENVATLCWICADCGTTLTKVAAVSSTI